MSFLSKLKSLFTIKEAVEYSANPWGDPIPYNYLMQQMMSNYNHVVNRDLYPYKSTTVRTLEQNNSVMFFGRYLYERNPNAKGLLNGFRNYVIGKGFTVKVIDKKKPQSSDQSAEPTKTIEGATDIPTAKPETVAVASTTCQQVQKILDDWCEHNDIQKLYDDAFIRAHRDGDVFLRLFPTEEFSELRAVEPDAIRPPPGENWEGDWSQGIQTKIDDWSVPLAYGIQYFKMDWAIVPANQIFHLKLNVSSNTKRGLSSFYPISEALDGVDKLRYATREGEKVRQAIAYFRQWALADKSSITALQQTNSTGSFQAYDQYSQGFGPYDVTTQKIQPGTVADVPEGMEVIPPSELTGAGALNAIKEGLYSIAASWNAPSWLVTGESNDTTYASSVEAGAPFLRAIEQEQEVFTQFWKKIFKAVVEIEIGRAEEISEDIFDLIEIHVDAPSAQTTNKKEDIDADMILVNAGVMSRQTLAAKHDLDYEEEIQKGAKEKVELPQNNQGTPPNNKQQGK